MLVQFWVTELYPCVWKNTVFNCEHFWHMSLKCIVFLYVIKYIIVNDCFVICVGSSLLSKTVDVTLVPNKGPTHSVLAN